MSQTPFAFGKPRTVRAAVLGAAIALLTSIGGCTMEPSYRRPDAPVTEAWPDSTPMEASGVIASHSTAPAAADIGWRDFFTDARLQILVRREPTRLEFFRKHRAEDL